MVPRQTQAGAMPGSTHPKSCHSLLPWGSDLWDRPTTPLGEGDLLGRDLSDGPRNWMDQGGNEGEKRNTEEKPNRAEDRLWCRNCVCGSDSFTYPSSSSWTTLAKHQQQLRAKEEPLR